jgi:hypothetical protein
MYLFSSEAKNDDYDDKCKNSGDCHNQALVALTVSFNLNVQLLVSRLHIRFRLLHRLLYASQLLSLNLGLYRDRLRKLIDVRHQMMDVC